VLLVCPQFSTAWSSSRSRYTHTHCYTRCNYRVAFSSNYQRATLLVLRNGVWLYRETATFASV